MDSEDGSSTIIRRDKHYQLGTTWQPDLQVPYRVHWKDDCTCQPTFDKLLRDALPVRPPTR